MSEGMTISTMLGQSGLLTLLGMCVVFGFIIILILCMKLLHVVVHALKLDKEEEPKSTVTNTNVSGASSTKNTADNKAIVAAIAASIHDKQLNS